MKAVFAFLAFAVSSTAQAAHNPKLQASCAFSSVQQVYVLEIRAIRINDNLQIELGEWRTVMTYKTLDECKRGEDLLSR